MTTINNNDIYNLACHMCYNDVNKRHGDNMKESIEWASKWWCHLNENRKEFYLKKAENHFSSTIVVCETDYEDEADYNNESEYDEYEYESEEYESASPEYNYNRKLPSDTKSIGEYTYNNTWSNSDVPINIQREMVDSLQHECENLFSIVFDLDRTIQPSTYAEQLILREFIQPFLSKPNYSHITAGFPYKGNSIPGYNSYYRNVMFGYRHYMSCMTQVSSTKVILDLKDRKINKSYGRDYVSVGFNKQFIQRSIKLLSSQLACANNTPIINSKMNELSENRSVAMYNTKLTPHVKVYRECQKGDTSVADIMSNSPGYYDAMITYTCTVQYDIPEGESFRYDGVYESLINYNIVEIFLYKKCDTQVLSNPNRPFVNKYDSSSVRY